MPLSDAFKSQIADLIAKHQVVLFMKGSRHFPQCGFSAQVVEILNELAPGYETVNVLSSPELREGIKEYSEWPAIPQLYVRGQFVGGCDIVKELKESGELQRLLGSDTPVAAPPRLTITRAARKILDATLAENAGEVLHLTIDQAFQPDLFLAPAAPSKVETDCDGLAVQLDPASARHADGITIDFVEGENSGFRVDNPNEPPKVKQLSAPQLKAMLDRGEVLLFDVRPDSERAIASIAAARSLDREGQEFMFGLPREQPIALHCHHGIRSQNAAQQLLSEGFRTVYNLSGGIEAWSATVDESVPRY